MSAHGSFDLVDLQALADLGRSGRVIAYWYPSTLPGCVSSPDVSLHYVVVVAASPWHLCHPLPVRDVLRMMFLYCN